MAGLNGAADLLRMKQYNQSLGIQDRMLGIYQQNADLDRIKYYNSLGNGDLATASSLIPQVSGASAADKLYNQLIGEGSWRRSFIPGVILSPKTTSGTTPVDTLYDEWARHNREYLSNYNPDTTFRRFRG